MLMGSLVSCSTLKFKKGPAHSFLLHPCVATSLALDRHRETCCCSRVDILRGETCFYRCFEWLLKGLPVAYLKEYQKQNSARGSFKIITSSVSTDPNRTCQLREVMAVPKITWKTAQSCSKPHRAKHRDKDGGWIKSREVVERTRPKIVEDGAKVFNSVAMNDRYRQEHLNMDDSWQTHKNDRLEHIFYGFLPIRRDLQTNERDGKISFSLRPFSANLHKASIFGELRSMYIFFHGGC